MLLREGSATSTGSVLNRLLYDFNKQLQANGLLGIYIGVPTCFALTMNSNGRETWPALSKFIYLGNSIYRVGLYLFNLI